MPTKEMIEKRKAEDIYFLQNEASSDNFICLKHQDRDKDGVEVLTPYGSCIKIGANKFTVFKGNIHAGEAEEIGTMTAEKILENWWVD